MGLVAARLLLYSAVVAIALSVTYMAIIAVALFNSDSHRRADARALLINHRFTRKQPKDSGHK